MKQVDVTILGQGYVLACAEDGQESLLRAVALVDREMSTIRDAGKIKARERIAVLAALNLAYRLAESESQMADLQAVLTAKSIALEASARVDAAARPGGAAGPRSADVQALIRRLDDVLAGDGRLL